MSLAVVRSDASCSNVSAEIAAAVTQIKYSLEDLANKCRDQGTDPMTMIMTIMSGRGGGGAAV